MFRIIFISRLVVLICFFVPQLSFAMNARNCRDRLVDAAETDAVGKLTDILKKCRKKLTKDDLNSALLAAAGYRCSLWCQPHDPRPSDDEGRTAMATALVTAGANPDLVVTDDALGISVMVVAMQNDLFEFTKFLLEKGANPNTSIKTGITPIFLIPEKSPRAMKYFDMLVNAGADPKYSTKKNWIVLHQYADDISAQSNLLSRFFDLGLDINAETSFHVTPLVSAIMNLQNTAVQVMLEHKADPNYIDHGEYHNTPLMRAVLHANYRAIDLLIRFGADPKFRNTLGKTACDKSNVDQVMLEKLRYCQ